MPSKKKAVQAATVADRRILEPQAPADLWAQLDALCVEHGMDRRVAQPPDTFTAAQYARQVGLHPSSATLRLHKLLRANRIELVGVGTSNEKFYRIKK